MKINTIIHKNTKKSRKTDLFQRNIVKDPEYHPFIQEREYIRALNSTKIDRLLAKPFVKAMSFHSEGINFVTSLGEDFASSSYNGEVIVWDIKNEERRSIKLENQCGMAFADPNSLLIGNRNEVFLFKNENNEFIKHEKYITGNVTTCIGHYNNEFVVGTNLNLLLFDMNKSVIKQNYGREYVNSLSFGPILGAGVDKDILLIDNRINKEFLRFPVGIKTNALQICSNLIISGNEDSKLYVHDIRYTSKPMITFHQHIQPILAIDVHENTIVSGSTDKTIRIFNIEKRENRDVYYNKRMLAVNGVRFSSDGKIIVSGSDDGSLRVWKTDASSKLEQLSKREEDAIDYGNALKEKFKNFPEIKKIRNHRFLPKPLKNQIKQKNEQYRAELRRKEEREKKRKEKGQGV